MSLASILFAVMVALIPFLARRIVTGEIGSSMMTVVHTVSTALGAVKGFPSPRSNERAWKRRGAKRNVQTEGETQR